MDEKLLVVLVLGLFVVGIAGYYLVVVVPQQQLFALQFQQQTQQAQVQTAIAYCQNLGQQYNFTSGGCEAPPITVSIGDWFMDNFNTQNPDGIIYQINPFNQDSFASRTIDNTVAFWNPFDSRSVWSQLGNSFMGFLVG